MFVIKDSMFYRLTDGCVLDRPCWKQTRILQGLKKNIREAIARARTTWNVTNWEKGIKRDRIRYTDEEQLQSFSLNLNVILFFMGVFRLHDMGWYTAIWVLRYVDHVVNLGM